MTTSNRSGIVQNSVTYRILAGSFVLGWLFEPSPLSRIAEGSAVVRALRGVKRRLVGLLSRASGPLLRAEDNSVVLRLFVRAYARVRTWYRYSIPGRLVSWWNRVE